MVQAALGQYNWCEQHQARIGAGNTGPELVWTALGQNWCGQHWAKIGVGNTGPKLVRVTLGQNWCRQHQARIGVGSTGPELVGWYQAKIGVDYTKQGHCAGAPKIVVTQKEWPLKVTCLFFLLQVTESVVRQISPQHEH